MIEELSKDYKLNNEDIKNIMIAYEPTDLIGNNNTYNLLKIRSMVLFIKKIIKDYYGIDIAVVFGGSIRKETIDDLINLNIIDGFIICTSVLNPKNIPELIEKIAVK